MVAMVDPSPDNGMGGAFEQRPVRRMALVGSAYDAYILREAGFPSVAEQQRGANGAFGPRPPFHHVTTIADAMSLLDAHEVDLLITDLEHPDGDAFALGRAVRARHPDVAVVLLTSKQHLGRSGVHVPHRGDVDWVFVWHGHSDIVDALVHAVEDARNLDFDVVERGLRFIVLVEDEPNVHSRFLPLIYREVREMTRSLLSPSLSAEQRARRMRDRTRLLLVETYEDAIAPLSRYPDHVLGVISDIQYPHAGRIDRTAGLSLVRYVKRLDRDIPVIIQSREAELQHVAEEAGAAFICKHSAHLLQTLRRYLRLYFGFGEFAFRDPTTDEPIARASTLRELRDVTPSVPLASFLYHATKNHFSSWLYVHGAHDLANELRPITGDGEPLRRKMLSILDRYL